MRRKIPRKSDRSSFFLRTLCVLCARLVPLILDEPGDSASRSSPKKPPIRVTKTETEVPIEPAAKYFFRVSNGEAGSQNFLDPPLGTASQLRCSCRIGPKSRLIKHPAPYHPPESINR